LGAGDQPPDEAAEGPGEDCDAIGVQPGAAAEACGADGCVTFVAVGVPTGFPQIPQKPVACVSDAPQFPQNAMEVAPFFD
jgi:hypothetical protein